MDGFRDPPDFVAAFFMRDAGVGDGRGIEFAHKSFAEFLYARHLIRVVRDAVKQPPKDGKTFSTTWGVLTGQQAMTHPIHTLFRQ